MAEPDGLVERAQAAAAALLRASLAHRPEARWREEGRVVSSVDGVLQVAGLPGARMEELLRVGRSHAQVVGLSARRIEAIALDDAFQVAVGERVERTGEGVVLPGGSAVLGRVLDPLGRPLDGGPAPRTALRVPLERPTPRIHERAAVHLPLLTGALVVDALFPIGRGQRELLLGDEGTGKTALALDALLAQRGGDVIGVWVAIGRRRSEVAQVVEALRSGGGRWVVVAAPEDASPGLRFLAPYAGCALGESFAWRGEHALVVFDHLTAHAVAWREVSLLLGRAAGREAFPGDVFHIHARLLERAAQLAPELGGGSLTALPIALTESGRVSGYIPTNLISITDGQLIFSQHLFAAGQKPAIDAGLSVSRIGARAQPQAMRELAAGLRLEYAAFLELEAFSRLGTRLEPEAQRRIEVGRRLRALLRAPRLEPLPWFDQVVRLVLARSTGLLASIPEAHLGELVRELVEAVRREHPGIARRVEGDGVLAEEDRQRLAEALAARVEERRGA